MNIKELDMYDMSMKIGEIVWDSVDKFSHIAKETIGKPFVRAADSISANISEGEGSGYSGDKIRHLCYAKASLLEAKTWLLLSLRRELIPLDNIDLLMKLLEDCLKEINSRLREQEAIIHGKV